MAGRGPGLCGAGAGAPLTGWLCPQVIFGPMFSGKRYGRDRDRDRGGGGGAGSGAVRGR